MDREQGVVEAADAVTEEQKVAEIGEYRLALSASKGWRRLRGAEHLAELVKGAIFKDGVKEEAA